MLSPDKFSKSSKLRESLVVNGDDPSHVTVEGGEENILECVCNCMNQDDLVIQALKELSTKGGLCSDEWQEKDGLVLYRGKIYIPWDNKLRFNIIKSHHNYPVAGHPG